MDYENRKHYEYFIGKEVERSTAYGMETLFVVGVKPVPDIVKLAFHHGVDHIFLGAHQSFNPRTDDEWAAWDSMVQGLLKTGKLVTIDFDVSLLNDIQNLDWLEWHNFIPMISVKIPRVDLLNYHAVLKIDVPIDDLNNAGVWCHRVQALTTPETYTGWHEYNGDRQVFVEDVK